MSEKLRVGIIGLGFGQAVTGPVFQAHPDTEVVAVAGTRAEKARDIAAKIGARRSYGSWRELLSSETLDILAIATPADVQVDILKEVLSQPQRPAVFAEKPLTVNWEQAEGLAKMFGRTPLSHSKESEGAGAASASNGKIKSPISSQVFFVDFEFPEIPEWREYKSRVQGTNPSTPKEAIFGPSSRIEVSWRMQNYANKHRLDNWKIRMGQGGGVLHAFGSHVFYNLEWFFAPIVRLKSTLSRATDDVRETYSRWNAEVEFSNGAKAKINVDSDDPNTKQHSFTLINGNDRLQLNNPTADYVNGFKVTLNGEPQTVGPRNLKPWQEPFAKVSDGRCYAASFLVDRFVERIKAENLGSGAQFTMGGSVEDPTLASGLRTQKLIEAAVSSHNHGGEWLNV